MKINDRLFKGILIAIALLCLVGYGLMFYLRLDHPIFVNHYYDLQIHEEDDYLTGFEPIQIQYITNVDDNRTIVEIEFPEYPDLVGVTPDDGLNELDYTLEQLPMYRTSRDTHGLYNVVETTIHIRNIEVANEMDGEVITEITLHFDDGSTQTAEIGELHFYSPSTHEAPVNTVGADTSSGETMERNFEVLEDLTLSSVESPLLENVSERVTLQIEDIDYREIEEMALETGWRMSSEVHIRDVEDIMNQYTLFDIRPELVLVTEDGTEYSERIPNISNVNNIRQSYNFWSLYQYVNEKEDD